MLGLRKVLRGSQTQRSLKIGVTDLGLHFKIIGRKKILVLFFSSYRSLFFWLDKKKGSKKYRKALPACLGKDKIEMKYAHWKYPFLVPHVRSLYPDDTYTGFQPSSPVIRNKRRRTVLLCVVSILLCLIAVLIIWKYLNPSPIIFVNYLLM